MNNLQIQAFVDELQKIAKELTTEGREHIKAKNFALSAKQSDTGEGKYPIHDLAHARNALVRVRQFGSPKEKAEVYKDVSRKYPELAERSSISAVQERAKESASLQGLGQKLKSMGSSALKAVHHAEDPIEVAGLGVLAAPGIDSMIARHRARKAGLADTHGHISDENVDKYRLIKEKYHDPVDVGGLGVLAAPLVAGRVIKGKWGH